MKRKKRPTPKPKIRADKEKLEKRIEKISIDWNADERETSILFYHSQKVVFLETSYPSTARRWFANLWGDPEVHFDMHTDSLKIQVPWEYCRQPDLILMAKHRKYDS